MSQPNDPPSQTRPAEQRGRRTVGAHQIVALLLLIVFLVFLAQNTRRVSVDLIVKHYRAPMFLVLIAAAVVGALLTLLLQWRHRHHR